MIYLNLRFSNRKPNETVQAETTQNETVQAETTQNETVQAETIQNETVQAEVFPIENGSIEIETAPIENAPSENTLIPNIYPSLNGVGTEIVNDQNQRDLESSTRFDSLNPYEKYFVSLTADQLNSNF